VLVFCITKVGRKIIIEVVNYLVH